MILDTVDTVPLRPGVLLALEALEKWDEAAAAFENASKSPAYRVRALIGAARARQNHNITDISRIQYLHISLLIYQGSLSGQGR